jgi:hypothetical protein
MVTIIRRSAGKVKNWPRHASMRASLRSRLRDAEAPSATIVSGRLEPRPASFDFDDVRFLMKAALAPDEEFEMFDGVGDPNLVPG